MLPPSQQNIKYFVDMLAAFDASFQQPDIGLFKKNLEALEILHQKQKLYQRPVFTEHVFFPLLRTFFLVLMRKSHNLLRDEIIVTAFNIASVDFDNFLTKVFTTC